MEFSFARSRFTGRRERGCGNDAVTIDERRVVFTTTELTTLRGGTGNDRGAEATTSLNGDANDDFLRAATGTTTLACGANVDIAGGGAGIDSQSNCETVVNVP